MNELTLKQSLEHALKNFSNGTLVENSHHLLQILGYRSQHTVELSPNTFEGFLEYFPRAQEIKSDKALVEDWLSVDILFQLTVDDIKDVTQGRFIFDRAPRIDNQIIESYLFIAISLKESTYTRTQLANLTREINKIFPMPVMIVIQHGENLTFSIIHRRIHKKDEARDVLEKVTLIKDISIKKPHRGHIEILFDLSLLQLVKDKPFGNFIELQKAWEKTLDTSELNKKFYKEIANWYFSSQKKVSFPSGGGEDVEIRNATNLIRLITRLIFVWFIKEKGLVQDELFDHKKLKEILYFSDPSNSTYYKAILQNLFFATLNTEMGSNRRFRGKNKNPNGLDSHYGISSVYRYEGYFIDPQKALSLFSNIPFLNGGLFECLDKREEKIIIDGFSDDPHNQPTVPDDLFFGFEHEEDLSDSYGDKNKKNEKVRGIINLFNDYKFTIEENTPVEEEIALDPELLGKVFENLLASYNPETGTTARKQTGSFYTPREIVNYMVDEALIEYLRTKLGELPNTEERLRHLFEYNQEDHKFTHEETRKLIDALDDVNVLDPACGSGAFPMGVLHKLVLILNKLDPGNKFWKEKQIGKVIEIPDPDVREKVILDIEQAFEDNELDYGRKLFLIENCIYGVDIQPIAVQIAKLRFFISLVVDQKKDYLKPNLGIRPLPNLETKFVAANTLIGIERPQQMMFRNPLIDEKEKLLAEVRSSLFTARTQATKRKYRNQDQLLREEIATLLKIDGWVSTTATKLAGWDPYDQNNSATFFDPEWMFGILSGFDVVIGNPPYGIIYDLDLKALYENSFETFKRNNDVYVAFYQKGIELLSESGKLVYISPNTFLNGDYYKKLREYINRKTKIKEICDYKETPIFDDPTVFVCVIILSKSNQIQFPYSSQYFVAKGSIENLEKNFFIVSKFSDSEFKPQNPLFGKLSNPDNYTNFDELFYIKDVGFNYWTAGKGKKRDGDSIGNRIFYSGNKKNPHDIEFIKGRDIGKWVICKPSNYLRNDYKDHLDPIRDTFRFSPDFLSITPKIVYRQTANRIIAAIDSKAYCVDKTVHIIVPKRNWKQWPPEIITAILNSKLFGYLYSYISQETEGRVFAQVKTTYIKKLPLPKFGDLNKLMLISQKIIDIKNNNEIVDTSKLEHEIDKLVYMLYGLTEDEVALVEGQSIDFGSMECNDEEDRERNTKTIAPKQIQSTIKTTYLSSEYGIYKCSKCGSMKMSFDLQNHEMEKHEGKPVEWKKID